jgi:hypothetical protein
MCPYLSVYSSTALWLNVGRFFRFSIIYTFGNSPWTGDQPITIPLPAHRIAQTQNKRTQTSMPQVRFEPMIPVFEQAKTVHALDGAVGHCDRPHCIQLHPNRRLSFIRRHREMSRYIDKYNYCALDPTVRK